jgi:hypothetical protein
LGERCGQEDVRLLSGKMTRPAWRWPDALRQRSSTDLYGQKSRGQTGQNILSATYLIQLQGKQYVSVWPENRATAKLEYSMKGWHK